MGMKDPKERVPYVLDMIYPHTYLDQVNPEDPSGGTFRELQTKVLLPTFPLRTNVLDLDHTDFFYGGDSSEHSGKRLCRKLKRNQSYLRRISYTRPQSLLGSLSQMWAALFHYVSPDRLAAINASIPKILILTGDNDHMVDPSNSFKLAADMPDAEFIQWEETGHGVVAQWPQRVAHLLERVFEEGSANARAELDATAPAGESYY